MSMNIFRLSGDMLHLCSILLLLWKLRKSKNCVGVSCQMQEIYAIVFVCRYVDLLFKFVSIYNSVMKIVFITSTFYTIYLIRFKPPISQTYNSKQDNFPYLKCLLPPIAVLGVLTAEKLAPTDILWSFSIWLESVAIIPQLMLLQAQKEVENLTSHYVFTMGAYRAFYLLNWVYRYFFEFPPYVNWVGWIAGIVQTALYLDFFYYFCISKWYGVKLVLPTTQV
ncbi:endoplasmic reticulum lumen protein retaining receptor (ERD2) family protein [Cardiosporidium cionae]|uniref:Endoplasmic reticulum lumen protein retaining receptor (ERD2) family protein n=1 Tax=Cardiosporidium cionae TaxID=476202 RepID=A0ABQ7J3W3_9APIC|nr:endoplasmic reticulum lumen protein retaining receptor (ERD2) family protein [Cardiosporidium cionae]|eukprot:KAF8817786.1 endoplasmic reticulum lumen protein retaining receptor (ERD2) family protein [Cardiosporidium cionae]